MSIEEFNERKPKEGDKMKVTFLIGNKWAKIEKFIYQSAKIDKKMAMITLKRVVKVYDEKRKCYIDTITISLAHVKEIKNYK